MSAPKLYTVCTNEDMMKWLKEGCTSMCVLVDGAVGYKAGDRIIFVGPEQELIDTRFFLLEEIKPFSEMQEEEGWDSVGEDYQPEPTYPGTANDNDPVVLVCSFTPSPLRVVQEENP